MGALKFKEASEGANNYGIDCMWASFAAWVTFFRDVCGLELNEEISRKFEINETLVRSCGWTWWHQNVLAISDRPDWIKRDEQGRLHSQIGHSIHYRDGWGVSSWHGVTIPDAWVMDKSSLDPKTALQWENIEQRRAACEILGWHRILDELNAKLIDRNENPQIGTLYEVDLPDAPKERFIKVLCGTGREFAINVDPSCKTALEAQQWMWNSEDYQPEIRT